jgi:diadenosine tetraphosphate (Ap4A) HIT family hydrolase
MCLFCDLKSAAVKENELSYFIYDKFPQSAGHALIIPKRHIETVFEMTDKEWASAARMIDTAKKEIEKKYAPKGYNIVANCGAAAGQQIMHAHIHLIPRY